MVVIIVGILFAINVGIAYAHPNPITIGGAIAAGCMFLINLFLFVR